MGRRSFGLSISQIERFASAARAASRARERKQLINNQKNISISRPPEYALTTFEFNPHSRVCHLEIQETKEYRTIERYVTQNRVRYPIYGDWKSRNKTIKKTIKLTNETLEGLNSHEDQLIREFRYDIIEKLENEDLCPSWFIIDALRMDRDLELSILKKETTAQTTSQNEKIAEKNKAISGIQDEIKDESRVLLHLVKKQESIRRRGTSARNMNHYALFVVLTLGIHALFHNEHRAKKLENKLAVMAEKVHAQRIIIEKYQSAAEELKEEIKELEADQIELKKKSAKLQEDILSSFAQKEEQVEPLPIVFEEKGDSFVPLKSLSGMNYEKIIGCYLIRNKENGKCYAGQSKDVMKRLTKQHFDGTRPNNIVFAEDYFTSKFPNKEDLFEVQIIRCSTKDELDTKERELIEEYECFSKGYNGTKGNT